MPFCKCLKTRADFKAVLCCIPLALFALLSSIGFVVWGAIEIRQTTQAKDWFQWSHALVIVLASLKAIMGAMGFVSVVLRWKPGSTCLVAAYKLLLMSIIMTFFMEWIQWIVRFHRKEKGFPDKATQLKMILMTLGYVVFFVLSWWIVGCFKSFAAVLHAGGHGWELQNAKSIREKKKAAAATDKVKLTSEV